MYNWIKLHTGINSLKDKQRVAATFISKANCLIWVHIDEGVKYS